MNTLPIKNRLLSRRYELLSRYHDELARATEELDSREIEDVDNASELWDARVLSILGNVDAAALARITAALGRLEDGTYGTCTDCADSIEPARLRVLPETSACYECALEAERAHGSTQARVPLRAAG